MEPKIAVIHGDLNVSGGSEALCFRIIETLKDDYRITLITDRTVNIRKANALFGTNLKDNDFKVKVSLLPFILNTLSKSRFIKWRWALLQKSAKRASDSYDLLFSASNEADFGRRGIQYLHFPKAVDELHLRKTGELSDDLARGSSVFSRLYLWIYRRRLRPDYENVRINRTLCNSEFTQTVFGNFYKAECEVVYPPITDLSAYARPWPEREDGFVCAGRIEPAKNVVRTVRILKKLKELGLNLHLHILGKPWDRAYAKKVAAECRGTDFLLYEGEVSREELNKLMGSHKYFIHGYDFEHFGMASAEAVSAGCIPFVPNSGGQVEIIGKNPLLCYSDEYDAVEKIDRVCRDAGLQENIREDLKSVLPNFSSDNFRRRIKEIVREELRRKA
ncbi:MAG: glycosyltransferase [Candidatus Omnitrophota bacterium]